MIDPDAVKVLYRLHRAGYQAYLVGGGVRDLLLDRQPKDFDIGTDAHPQQVKRLFRNCRLIGRRFRLAHVHFGGKIVEVSTFRRRTEPDEAEEGQDILIRSDNTFGTAEEDALRRDFTINGLFYDIGSFSVIDYVGGLPDLEAMTIRTIGEPDIRFREDPVRMIRAVKFAARLGFTIEAETWAAMLRHRQEIEKSATPRVLEEIYRLLGGGAAEASFRLLARSGLLEILLPEVAAVVEEQGGPDAPVDGSRFWGWLAGLDEMKAAGPPPTNALLVSGLLAELALVADEDVNEPWRITSETEDAVREVLIRRGVPRRDTERLFQIYRALRRFAGARGRRFSPRTFVLKNYFPEAFLFFRLATRVTGAAADTLLRWESLAAEAGIEPAPTPGRRRRRRRRRGRDREPGESFDEAPPSEEAAELDSPADTEEDPEPAGADDTLAAAPPAPAPAPPARRARHRDDDEDEDDSQIKFLGWSDQPEILRDRPEPAPVINPYTRRTVDGGRPAGRGPWKPRSGSGYGGGPGGGGRGGTSGRTSSGGGSGRSWRGRDDRNDRSGGSRGHFGGSGPGQARDGRDGRGTQGREAGQGQGQGSGNNRRRGGRRRRRPRRDD